MHTVVHETVLRTLVREPEPELAWLAVRTVGRATSTDSGELNSLLEQRLKPHSDRCFHSILDNVADPFFTLENPLLPKDVKLDTALIFFSSMYRLGKHYRHQKRMSEDAHVFERATEGYSDILGADHPITLDAAKCQAVVLAYEEKLDEAENIYLRVLRGFERTLGLNDPSTYGTADTLAQLYHKQGKYHQAEGMVQIVPNAFETTKGSNDPGTVHMATTLGRLIFHYREA